MNTFLVILLVAAMLATVVALVRGIVSFLQEASANARGEGGGPTAAQLKSNRMMQQRILFQALAVLVVVVMLFAAGRT
ncbi:twin transmembrane helix small protein [Sphingomonas yunnanensis]|uniref:twin transmembrane helix small protein n=1 Tax=Sphingomonas yunnanensis TaxID=310400 RepID=UPI001CA73C0E|nr:twin transmembrane helix small protein [Sphingomonas yunnanensis]MBY9063688.1 twin transmembrane helix small protein [Sphingomonas yunnanensis]